MEDTYLVSDEDSGDTVAKKLEISSSEDSSGDDANTAPVRTGTEGVSSQGSRKKPTTTKPGRARNPAFIEMIVDAIRDAKEGKKGVSVPAIKTHMRANHDIKEVTMKSHFKRAMEKAINDGTLIRPLGSKESRGITGRFKVSPDYLKERAKKTKTSAAKKKAALTTKTKPSVKKERPKVNKDNLKSLNRSSAVAKAAKEKIKKARLSVGLSKAPARGKSTPTLKGGRGKVKIPQKAKSKSKIRENGSPEKGRPKKTSKRKKAA